MGKRQAKNVLGHGNTSEYRERGGNLCLAERRTRTSERPTRFSLRREEPDSGLEAWGQDDQGNGVFTGWAGVGGGFGGWDVEDCGYGERKVCRIAPETERRADLTVFQAPGHVRRLFRRSYLSRLESRWEIRSGTRRSELTRRSWLTFFL